MTDEIFFLTCSYIHQTRLNIHVFQNLGSCVFYGHTILEAVLRERKHDHFWGSNL